MPFGVGFFDSSFPEDDFLVIGADKSPGVAIVRNLGVASTYDIRKGYGFSGATAIYTGEDLPKFSVEFQFWKAWQWADWQDFAKKYLEKPTRSPVPGQVLALGIKHAILNASPYNIDKCVRLEVSGPEQDEFGLWTLTASFLQYRPPQLFLAKPNGAIPAVSKPIPTPRDAAEERIEQLRAQRDALAAVGG